MTASKIRGKPPRSGYPEYGIWTDMRSRCSNPKASQYKWYGGRGIKVCDRWNEDFYNFIEDMGPRPSSWAEKGVRKRNEWSIDRIDCNGNYEPGNCRWATTKQQALNRTNSRPRVAVPIAPDILVAMGY